MIVLEGLIEQFIYIAGASPYNDDDTFSTEEKTQRGYCILVLLEFAIISFLYVYAYSKKVTPPPAETTANTTLPASGISFGSFFCEIMAFRDVFGVLTLKENMEEPLASNKL